MWLVGLDGWSIESRLNELLKLSSLIRARWLQEIQATTWVATCCDRRSLGLQPSNQVATQAKLGLQPGCGGSLRGVQPPSILGEFEGGFLPSRKILKL